MPKNQRSSRRKAQIIDLKTREQLLPVNQLNPTLTEGEYDEPATFGQSFFSADINDDGYGDLIVGAPAIRMGQWGQVYVVLGNGRDNFSPSINLSNLNGTNGFIIFDPDSSPSMSGAGWSVSAIDIDRDSFKDIIIGAPFPYASISPKGVAGKTYVVLSGPFCSGYNNPPCNFPANISLGELTGNNGFVINGIVNPDGSSDYSGYSVAAGDLNGDGFPEVIMGAPMAKVYDVAGNGRVHVLLSNTYCNVRNKPVCSFPPSINVTEFDGSKGFSINNAMDGATILFDQLGHTITVSDIEGDGLKDIIAGAQYGRHEVLQNAVPRTAVILSSGYCVSYRVPACQFPAEISTASLNGTNGFALNSLPYLYNTIGSSNRLMSTASNDIDADNFPDIIVAAQVTDENGYDLPPVSVALSGAYCNGYQDPACQFPAEIELSTLNGTTGFMMTGMGIDEPTSISVAARSILGGGSQVMVGSTLDSKVYVFLPFPYCEGDSFPPCKFPALIDVTKFNGTTGFVMTSGLGAEAGRAVGAGDIEGTGLQDMMVSADDRVYIVDTNFYCRNADFPCPLPANINLDTLNGTNGIVLRSGLAVSSQDKQETSSWWSSLFQDPFRLPGANAQQICVEEETGSPYLCDEQPTARKGGISGNNKSVGGSGVAMSWGRESASRQTSVSENTASFYQSVGYTADHGLLKGTSSVLRHVMEQDGYDAKTSEDTANAMYYLGYWFLSFMRHSQNSSDAFIEDDFRSLMVTMIHACLDVFYLFMINRLLAEVSTGLRQTAKQVSDRGWVKTGGVMAFLSQHVHKGRYMKDLLEDGPVTIVHIAAGATVQKLVEYAGGCEEQTAPKAAQPQR